ncbi:hypothetical protein LTR66_001185 [Elasticomyces elasticus]|nr:hypothetical protein LTR66_001185 [Elasticomyces elasticus]KAK5009791.1 hypothetical protein LTR28_013380 [Elasticomyces elasticus]
MPPHLHPHSRSTSTLFTTCLAVSFLVVGMPHILPCPVNPRKFADSTPDQAPSSPDDASAPRRRRRKPEATRTMDGEQDGMANLSVPKRECPVPKPGGLVGQVLGFKPQEREKPPHVVVKPLRSKGRQDREEHANGPEINDL